MARSPFSLRIPPEIDAEIAAAAEAQRRSKAWVIIEVLKQWFAYQRRPPTPPVPPKRKPKS